MSEPDFEKIAAFHKRANECMKLLDNKWVITIFKNGMGTYSAVAQRPGQSIEQAQENEKQITDDFTPAQLLYRITEKVMGRIVVSDDDSEVPSGE
jgi:hypothetical protein